MKFLKWLWYSSENPQNVALTIKAGIPLIISSIVLIASQFNFTLDSNQLEAYSNSMIIVVTGFLTGLGVLRKMYYTFAEKEVVSFTKKKTTKTTKKASK